MIFVVTTNSSSNCAFQSYGLLGLHMPVGLNCIPVPEEPLLAKPVVPLDTFLQRTSSVVCRLFVLLSASVLFCVFGSLFK
jgi:hypothetical protein